MAIEFMTSDAYHTDDDTGDAALSDQFVRDGWWQTSLNSGNKPLYYATGGPFGTGAWSHGRYSNVYSRIPIGSSVGATFMFAGWFNHTLSNANCVAVFFGNDTNKMSRIFFNSSGTIAVARNTTTLGTSTAQFTYGRWNHLALKVLMHDSTGTVDLVLNGTNILSLTSQDTLEGATASINYFELYGDDDNALHWSQPIIWGATGDAPTDLFGLHKIWPVRPNAEGTPNDFTPQGAGDNYVEVDEAEADDDTTYNESGTSTDEDRFPCENLPETPDNIYAVQSRVLAKQTDAGNLGLKNGVYSGTTKSVSAERKCALDYEYHTNLFTLNPDDSAAWAEADVNACEVVYEVG